MDNRVETLKSIVIDLLQKRIALAKIADWVHVQDMVLHDEPYFKDLRAATGFVLATMGDDIDDEEYSLYRDFFDERLKGAKKDIISGRLVEFDGRQWQSVLLGLDAMKSYAKAKGLKPHSVQMHLDRYSKKKKAELLIDVPEWDGTDRIAALKDYITLKTQTFEVFEEALKEWGANIFRRLYHDGAQNRCIILKGGQGMGKDHILKSLLRGFGPYYSKFSAHRNENDCWAEVTSKLILHIEEFDQTGRIGVAFLKDLITRDWVTYRSPYDRASATSKCVGSFISTVNIDAILRDETGNRRFAVFEIDSISWNYPKDWSAQVLAQFHELYKSDYRAKAETWQAVVESNSQFEQVDMVPELLSIWDENVGRLSENIGKVELTPGEVAHVVNDLCRFSGWKSKTLLSMLKSNKRSRHSMRGALYWSSLRKVT